MSSPLHENLSQSSTSLKCQQILRPPLTPSPSSTTPVQNHNFESSADELLFQRLYQQKRLSSVEHDDPSPSPVWSCSWSHDGRTLATAHGRPGFPCVRIWKFHKYSNEWKLSATLRQDDDGDNMTSGGGGGGGALPRTIRAVEFAYTPPNVRYILACASFDGTVRIWEDFSSESNGNTTTAQQNLGDSYGMDCDNSDNDIAYANTNAGWENTAQLEGHENEVKDISWNSTGTLLATCGRDKTIWIWECFLPGLIGSQGNGSTSFNPDGIAGGNNGGGGQGDFECISILTSHTGDVKDVEFTSSLNQFGDGDDILLSASYDDTIKVWAEEDGEWYCALTLTNVHTSTIWSIALSSSGVRMISASADCSIGIWKFYTIGEKRQMVSDDKKGDSDDNIDMGSYSDGLWKCTGKLPNAHKQPIYTVHCAPSRAGHGRIVSGGGDDSIQIYREILCRNNNSNNSSSTSESPLFTSEVCIKRAHDGDVNCVRWHPLDGSILASVGDDGLVKIWKYSQ